MKIDGMIARGTQLGVDFPVNCPTCKRYLTMIKLTPYGSIDIRVTCRKCGDIAVGTELWADILGDEPEVANR